jgi:hypothetical protein
VLKGLHLRIIVFLHIHRHSVLLLPVSLQIMQRFQLLWALLAGINVRFAVVSQTVLFQVVEVLETIAAEVAGESVGRENVVRIVRSLQFQNSPSPFDIGMRRPYMILQKYHRRISYASFQCASKLCVIEDDWRF